MKVAATLFLGCAVAAWTAEPPKVPPTVTKAAVTPVTKPAPQAAQTPTPPATAPAEAPKAAGKLETLRFNVNWPSGLSLGEGELVSSLGPGGWKFAMKVDAAIPAFPIAESAISAASTDLCSTELIKEATRGRRKVNEETKFDASTLKATRRTTKVEDGGKTEMRVNACAKDALTFIQFIRRELAAGRIPASQSVYYGAAYQTRIQYMGTQRVRVANEMVEADRLNAFVKGPATEFTVELLFSRNPGRTPISATIPVTIGKFTVEFER